MKKDWNYQKGGRMEGKIKRLTLRIEEAVHRKLKVIAAAEGKTMVEIVVECIEDRYKNLSLKEVDKAERRRRN
jgi:hypothetical protein